MPRSGTSIGRYLPANALTNTPETLAQASSKATEEDARLRQVDAEQFGDFEYLEDAADVTNINSAKLLIQNGFKSLRIRNETYQAAMASRKFKKSIYFNALDELETNILSKIADSSLRLRPPLQLAIAMIILGFALQILGTIPAS